jgi:hypothetical protein
MRVLERAFTFTLNPGFRYAINFRDDSQLVMGFSVPVTLTKDSSPDYGLLSFPKIPSGLGVASSARIIA